ncbi:tetratricopeptide repeat protein [Amycolatopsis sp. EV170708-02-1]|nr:BTAD domain-containing putative transcriptional regulator [Amycolatopsis sp. EV170708-02-1]UMP07007.1 tetratricopeptide repeat protein [Amycolatopsis sp. EV170708-02-1]
MLAMRAGEIVSLEEIIDGLWGETPPGNPVASVYTYISGLRRALDPHRDSRSLTGRLRSASPGYRLSAEQLDVDVDRFTTHLATGHSLLASDPRTAARELESALSLWRENPLAGTTGPFVDGARQRLQEQRFGLIEDHATALLIQGRHDDALGELRALAADYPIRERPQSLLMQALYRSGKQADALAVFADVRNMLARELGIDPSPFLTRLRDRIADGDPELLTGIPQRADLAGSESPGTQSVPAQLPTAIPSFIGRTIELSQLREFVTQEAPGHSPAAPAIGIISGPGGVGKTTMSVHLAHDLTDRFPDGQLFVNLRGFDPHEPPVNPTQALAKLLGDLGGYATTPGEGLAELSARFRSMLSGKRMLLLLDNALTSEQVRPLLPGSSCLVLITSRNRLDGLVVHDGAQVLDLRPLRPAESRTFLARSVGDTRTSGVSEDLDRIAALCGHLPLALSIVARRLALRTDLRVRDVVAELSREGDRLSALAPEGTDTEGIRPVFSWSYQALKPEPARMFRRLGLYPGEEISAGAAAALHGTSVVEARRLLDILANSHLITWSGRGRYQIHDLIHLYAKELVREDETVEQRSAATRHLLDWYLYTLDNSNRVLEPARGKRRMRLEPPPDDCDPVEFADSTAAAQWVIAESSALRSIVRYAAELGYDEHVWKIVSAVWEYLRFGPDIDEWIELQELAVVAAERRGDDYARMWSIGSIAHAYNYARRIDKAMECFTASREYWRNAGAAHPDARLHEAVALAGSAHVHYLKDEFAKALECCARALPIVREEGDGFSDVWLLSLQGTVYRKQGKLLEAEALVREGLQVYQRQAQPHLLLESHVLRDLGRIKHDQGSLEEAAVYLNQSLVVAQQLGNALGEVRVLTSLQQVLLELGQLEEADRFARLAAGIMEKYAIPADLVAAMASD